MDFANKKRVKELELSSLLGEEGTPQLKEGTQLSAWNRQAVFYSALNKHVLLFY